MIPSTLSEINRLVRSCREEWHLERPSIKTIDDAMTWFYDRPLPVSKQDPRRFMEHLLFCRWRFRREFTERSRRS
jgi:hypothetical protein